jgi:two-component sensor histidine kinase
VHSAGKRERALALLREADKRHPNDLDILAALLSMSREAGDRRRRCAMRNSSTRSCPAMPILAG